jgi:hypothetical protein
MEETVEKMAGERGAVIVREHGCGRRGQARGKIACPGISASAAQLRPRELPDRPRDPRSRGHCLPRPFSSHPPPSPVSSKCVSIHIPCASPVRGAYLALTFENVSVFHAHAFNIALLLAVDPPDRSRGSDETGRPVGGLRVTVYR